MDDLPANPTAAALITMQRETHDLLRQIRDALVSREEPSAGLFRFFPQALRTHVRVRGESIVVSSTAALTLEIRAGTKPIFTFPIAANSVASFTLPIVFDRGVTVELIDTTTGIAPVGVLDAIIVGHADYSESEAGRHSALHERLT